MTLPQSKNRRPGAGVYPGSGVARGGQQGRAHTIHNGVGGAIGGGSTPAASQRAAVNHAIGGTAAALHGFGFGFGGHAAPVNPAVPLPAAPAPAPVAAPNFGTQQDAQYWTDIARLQQQRDDAVNPLQAQLAGLQSTQYGGKTLYDSMYEQAQNQFLQQVRDARVQASKSGLLHSGNFDTTQGGLGGNWLQQQGQLDNQYGQTAMNNLQTQIGQAQSGYDTSSRDAALAAAARYQQNQQQFNANAFAPSQTSIPSITGN